jgi:hypothetical protein
MTPPAYSILIPAETLARASAYLGGLNAGTIQAGARLRERLRGVAVAGLTGLGLLGELIDTKVPQIFAEREVAGDGSDWSLTELGLLGDISIAVPVTVFDNGRHFGPMIHYPVFPGTLIYTPGALLRHGGDGTPADIAEVTGADGELSEDGYYGLYRRRLLPVFRFVNARADGPRSAVLTIPGLGCGQFAGPFRGRLGEYLRGALQRLLTEHGADFPNIRAVYYDPYNECENARSDIHGVSFMVRPLKKGNEAKSQLCRPEAYAEEGDDFSACSLFSVVAWDHVSWPGNDFYGGSRSTDDGVKAAATSTMSALTGVKGEYDPTCWSYLPPKPYRDWEAAVVQGQQERGLRLWRPEAVWPSTGP